MFEALRYGLLIVATVVVGYPVLSMILQSFKTSSEMYAEHAGLPSVAVLENYGRAIEIGMLR